MTKSKMITIITATYNSGNSIHRAIESLLAQDLYDFEHLVVDGLSTDNTIEIIQTYKDEYEAKGIKLTIISEKDNGLYDALNKGIHLASGSIIGILNSDDWYESNTISLVSHLFKSDPFCDIVMGASLTVSERKKHLKYPKNGKIITSRGFNHGAMFVKKACFEEIGSYLTNGNYYADFEWYIRARKNHKKFLLTSNNLYNFSLGGMSTNKRLSEVPKRINYRYEAYKLNGCSKFYFFECVLMEIMKFLLV